MEQSFLVLALQASLVSDRPAGVTELVPTHRTLAVFYDPLVISFQTLSAIVREHEQGLETPRELPSRLVEIPIWYGDPWSRECAAQYGVQENLSYLAEINDTTVDGVVAGSGEPLRVDAPTLCRHGDAPGSEQTARAVRDALRDAGIEVVGLARAMESWAPRIVDR